MFDAGKTRMIGLPYGRKTMTIMLSRFHLIPERYGQTDRQTDRQTDLLYQYRASVCWRAIKTQMWRHNGVTVDLDSRNRQLASYLSKQQLGQVTGTCAQQAWSYTSTTEHNTNAMSIYNLINVDGWNPLGFDVLPIGVQSSTQMLKFVLKIF